MCGVYVVDPCKLTSVQLQIGLCFISWSASVPRKPTSGRVIDGRWNLVLGEDSYSGQNAQNPATARKVQSWIATDDGQLHRELVNPKYLPTQLSGPVVGLYATRQLPTFKESSTRYTCRVILIMTAFVR